MTASESIDVVMCTWNSNRFYFRRCLASVKKEVDVHHFIVIDRFSSDGTLEVVRSVFPDAKIFQTAANLGHARRIGITYVDTRYFAFVDDDIELSDGWSTKLISLIKRGNQIGAVQGFARYFIDYLDKEEKLLLSRRKQLNREITDRGYTYNTVLETDIVRDFDPPHIIHSWEDFLMTQHVIRKGYKWLETSQVQVTHYRDAEMSYLSELRTYFLRAKWDGAGDRLVHIPQSSVGWRVANQLLNSSRSILYSLIIAIVVLDPRILPFRFLGQVGYLSGFLSPRKNMVPYPLRSKE
jgi:glycosyltransferase involved in cell wall biosynthesis